MMSEQKVNIIHSKIYQTKSAIGLCDELLLKFPNLKLNDIENIKTFRQYYSERLNQLQFRFKRLNQTII
jgi:hypothetical protein